MLNKISILGWVFTMLAAIGLSVPFWFFWTFLDIGKIYFYFIPEIFRLIPFWDCVGLFIVIAILKGTLIPKIFTVSNNQESNHN